LQIRLPGRPALVVSLEGTAALSELYGKVDSELKRDDYVLTMPFPPPPTHLDRTGRKKKNKQNAVIIWMFCLNVFSF
jgi:hypothetical protein